MKFFDLLMASLRSIRGNLLRASITMLIIAFGIAALVGILTAIDTAIYSMSANFSSLGSTSFTIKPKPTEIDKIVRGKPVKETREISYKEAMDFKKRFDLGRVAVSLQADQGVSVLYDEERTDPILRLLGGDENELFTRGHVLSCGRFFTAAEVRSARKVVVIGDFTLEALFNGSCSKALGERINIDGHKYQVIGVIAKKGSSMNESSDKKLFIPVTVAKQRYASARSSFRIDVGVTDMAIMDDVIEEAYGTMRKIRTLDPKDDNDFEITKADGLIGVIRENTQTLRGAAIGIGLITLLGAAIGLMNIMLVSVTERTKEIGVAKSVGARRSDIISQFLLEAILICQFGGLFGIALGILAGFVVGQLMDGPFHIPWLWIFLGMTLCMIVGLSSGLYPAMKAAKMDPIESLRYE